MPRADPDFLRPSSVDEAIRLLAGSECVVLAGGTSVGLLIGQGLMEAERLVWLGGIAGLSEITTRPGTLRIGAGATLRELACHPEVIATATAVSVAAGSVGNPRVRAVATVGGALAHADPRQDLPPALAACGAEAEIVGPSGSRRVPVSELATGFLETVLEPDELLTAVEIPTSPSARSVYLRYTPGSVADFPTVAAAASVVRGDDNEVQSVRLVLGAVGSTPMVVPEAAALTGKPGVSDEETTAVASAARTRVDPVSDRLGSAEYKREMAAVWAGRALKACLAADGERGTSRATPVR